METRIFISNIPFQASEADLKQLFGTYGAVTDVNLVIDKKIGKPKGIAFITMDNVKAARRAIQRIHCSEYMGRTLNVSEALERHERNGAAVPTHEKPVEQAASPQPFRRLRKKPDEPVSSESS